MPDGIEITTDQARSAARLRRRWPDGLVISHQRDWGVILEVRVAGRTVDVVALMRDGRVEPGRDVGAAAA